MKYLFEKDFWGGRNEAVIKTDIQQVALRLEDQSSFYKKRIAVFDKYHVGIGKIEGKTFGRGIHFYIYYDEQLLATLHYARVLLFKRMKLTFESGKSFSIKMKSNKSFSFSEKIRTVAVFGQESPNDGHYTLQTKVDKQYAYGILCASIGLMMSK